MSPSSYILSTLYWKPIYQNHIFEIIKNKNEYDWYCNQLSHSYEYTGNYISTISSP